MSHIEKCRNLYYATLKVPEGLRQKLGRTKFKQSLGTADKRRAQQLAAPVVAMWKAQIRQAQGEPDAVHAEALRWRDALLAERSSGDPENVAELELLLTSKAEDIEGRSGRVAADQFANVALGLATPSTLHYEAWVGSVAHLAPKTQDQMKKDVQRLTTRFSTLEEATPQAIRQWVDELTSRGPSPASPSSVKRMVTFWRSYWNYLEGIEAVPAGSKPFSLVRPPTDVKKTGQGGWVPFKPDDVPSLVRAAQQRGDTELTDLIVLGAYTGARIEELCALKVEHLRQTSFRIVDSKTEAGVREVPIHVELRPVVERLKAASSDGYLLSGLTFNKYDDRSNAIGKRFGRLKTALGHGPKHVFHSLRKTLVTMLEDAGVSENLAADIVGHEKPRITYGLYSGGASLATKADALARVRYEGLSLQ